jgi:hypothetical protein
LKSHPAIHLALRDALLEREELVGEEILDVIRAAILQDRLVRIDLTDVMGSPAAAADAARPAPQ